MSEVEYSRSGGRVWERIDVRQGAPLWDYFRSDDYYTDEFGNQYRKIRA